jgi:hypothetical protein
MLLNSYPATATLDLLKTVSIIELVILVGEEVAEGVNVLAKFNYSATGIRQTRDF